MSLDILAQGMFVKTCRWKKSQLGTNSQSLFCLIPRTTRYGMKQCKDKSCQVCYERLDITDRFEKAINFSNDQIHQFVNNYMVYLNCDVVSMSMFCIIYEIFFIDLYNIECHLCFDMSMSSIRFPRSMSYTFSRSNATLVYF